MTLKDFAAFVVEFSFFLKSSEFDSKTKEIICRHIVTFAVPALLGSERANVFLHSFGMKFIFEKDVFGSCVINNGWLFLEMLAKFCEPLLVKSGEEKGDQNAAKV